MSAADDHYYAELYAPDSVGGKREALIARCVWTESTLRRYWWWPPVWLAVWRVRRMATALRAMRGPR